MTGARHIRRIGRLLFLIVGLLAVGPRPASAIDIQRVTSAGGIEAWLIEDHTNPIISVNFAFRGGSALDPAGKEGLADMVSGLLDEGAGPLDSMAFQTKLEDLAITLRFEAGRDTFGGRLATLTENRDAAFDLLRLALTEPRFDTEPVERIRGQILSNLRHQTEDPNSLAYKALFAELFPGHPYGRPSEGTEDSINAITAADLRGFSVGRLARDNLVIGAVGDISPRELASALDQAFGKLPERAAPWQVAAATPRASGTVSVVKKAFPQSTIVFAQRGLMRDDPDYYVAYVLNHILGGGGFTSRLYTEVRDKRGLAYSVYSALVPMDFAGLVMGGAGTRNDRAADTVKVIQDEWRRMATEGPTAKELDDAKLYLTGSFPLQFSSSDRISGILTAIQLDDLGIDYLDKRNAMIEAVTLEDARRLARSLLDPAGLRFVVVGQPAGIGTGG
ncbi:M16 family metallopeptidase [Shumkonia mesophila]|uniref:M16 family metallopeptidase n=1 Tax=Shumkonia mesophila TaxID=2838854 RepID=UPI0029342C7F|nr:pitrilysin family protein [Shumkonia mesophila]